MRDHIDITFRQDASDRQARLAVSSGGRVVVDDAIEIAAVLARRLGRSVAVFDLDGEEIYLARPPVRRG